MIKLLIIRHGQTDWNIQKRLQGHRDIALNSEGLRQAAALGNALSAEPVGAIFSSDMQRALHTAQAIAGPCGMSVRLEAGLRERCFGAFEGLLHPEVCERYPEAHAAWLRRDLNVRYPVGEGVAETLSEFTARAIQTVVHLAETSGHQKIMLVTHAGVLDTVYRHATGMDYEHPRNFPVLNASINRMTWDGKQLQIDQWADVSHLE